MPFHRFASPVFRRNNDSFASALTTFPPRQLGSRRPAHTPTKSHFIATAPQSPALGVQFHSTIATQRTAAQERQDNMSAAGDACREMEANGVTKQGQPTEAAAPKQEQQKELPKLSPAEFRLYNRMAEHMDMFHNNFRQTWNLLRTACTTGQKPQGMTLRSFLQAGDDFAHHLTIHHTIEERHIFPVLAKKMPAFRKELELLSQHKEIHNGLEKFEAYIAECRAGERELRFGELGDVMDSFGKVLWEHLDEEVHELRAENMRLFWSQDEMRRLPM